MRALIPLAARRSDRIIAPSNTTRRDLVRFLNLPEEKIDVVPNGIGLPPAARWVSEEDLRRRYDFGSRPLLLTVSLKRPNKNLLGLLDALSLIPAERRPLLVLAGHATQYEQELRGRAADLDITGDTRFLNWVASDELEGLYRAATAFAFPSLYEGFGLPVLEAMTRGLPVACSNRGALGEVADDAALLFDPEEPRAIAVALEKLLVDEAERERLISLGYENAARFSWAETARKTLASYESALAYSAATS
jgi:glycosyltransferase involved in cell wall biosynthesis